MFAAVSHGTTVATNAVLQEDFSGLGFVTTEGFRCVLEIARQSVPEGYGNSYFWVKPDRIVPLQLVKEVPERLDAAGEVVREFDEDAAAAVARWYKDRGIDAVGICFVNAYVNPAHEQAMREVFEREHPGCAVSISSDVLREYPVRAFGHDSGRCIRSNPRSAIMSPASRTASTPSRMDRRRPVLRHEEQWAPAMEMWGSDARLWSAKPCRSSSGHNWP